MFRSAPFVIFCESFSQSRETCRNRNLTRRQLPGDAAAVSGPMRDFLSGRRGARGRGVAPRPPLATRDGRRAGGAAAPGAGRRPGRAGAWRGARGAARRGAPRTDGGARAGCNSAAQTAAPCSAAPCARALRLCAHGGMSSLYAVRAATQGERRAGGVARECTHVPGCSPASWLSEQQLARAREREPVTHVGAALRCARGRTARSTRCATAYDLWPGGPCVASSC